jgi:hypothetical protein
MDNSHVRSLSGDQKQAIREAAYSKWDQAGRPPSDGVAFWLEAEREFWSCHQHEAADTRHALIVRPKALPKPAEKRASRKRESTAARPRP